MAIPQTTALSTRHPIDRKSVYIAAGLLSGVGALISSTMPMVIGTMAATFEFSESQLGDIMAIFNVTFTLIAIASVFFVRQINWKLAALLGSGISVTALLASTLTDSYRSITTLFGIMGIGIGGLYALGMVVMGDSENPDRAFGVKLGLEALPSTILLFLLPVFVIPIYGFTGMAYAMAATCLVIGFLGAALPSRGVKTDTILETIGDAGSTAHQTSTAPLTRSLLTLVAGIIFFSGIIATWAFLEIIGTSKGLATDRVGLILGAGMISSAVGAFVAAWLGNRFGRYIPLIAIMAVNVASLTVIWLSTSIASFAAGAILFTFCVNYGLAYFFGLSAEVDFSGRFVGLSATTLSLGGVAGPALGGRIIESQGSPTVLAFSALCSILSLAIYIFVVRSIRV